MIVMIWFVQFLRGRTHTQADGDLTNVNNRSTRSEVNKQTNELLRRTVEMYTSATKVHLISP